MPQPISSAIRQSVASALPFLFIALSLPVLLQARTLVVLTDEQDEYRLGFYLEVLEDTTRRLTITDVISPQFDQRFIRNQTAELNLGLANSVYWIRFPVINRTNQTGEWWFEIGSTEINNASLYYPRPDGQPGFEVIHGGNKLPVSAKDAGHYYPVFHVPLAPQSEEMLYLRVESLRLTLPLTLWSGRGFIRKSQNDFMFLGLYLGVLFIMTGYNTFLFLVLRDKGYLYYVLFMVSLLSIEVLQRHLPQRFLWPDQVWLNSGVALIPVATIVFIFLLRFAASFLMSKINAPKLHPAFLVLQTGLCITALLFLLLSKTILFLVLWLVLILVCVAVVLITGLFVWKRGYRPARYFVTALLMLLVAVFISVLSVLGFVPKSYTEHVVHTGVVAMAFLMSLALADRINTIKHEREEAQAEVVRKQQEMLQLKDNFAATLQKHNDDLKRNIAEREQAEAEIRLLNNELESRVDERTAALRLANKELETFAYTVSHDLRGPLRAINGFAATLQEEYDRVLDDAGRAYLQRLQMAGMRMSGLIDHLLQLSRLIRTQMRLEIVDLSALAVDIVEELRAAFPERRVEFSVDPELKTLGDAKLLRVALENLLGNAWKFTEHRDPAVVAFRSLRVNGGLKLQITDNGAGFDMALAQKLFQPFQRLHRDDEFEGTGIGLATVSRIIKRHGGCIWAESEPGKGATFYFTLATSPLADPDAVARSAILVNAIGGKK